MYCAVGDLLTGDMAIGAKYGTGEPLIQFAADEIDAAIGHIYVTPVELPDTPASRPSSLLLKKINILLASGRLIMDQAIGGEDNETQAYGRSLLQEAKSYLEKIISREIILIGAPLVDDKADDENTAISILQEDPVSLVESFYTSFQTRGLGMRAPIEFYAEEQTGG